MGQKERLRKRRVNAEKVSRGKDNPSKTVQSRTILYISPGECEEPAGWGALYTWGCGSWEETV